MADPSEPDPTPPLPPAPGGLAQHRDGKPISVLALSMLLLVVGAGLAYVSLTLRWGYFDLAARPLTASDWATLTPADRARMTIWWGDTTNGCWCGPLHIILPAVVLLSSLPLLVAAMRQHAASRWWSRFGQLCAVCGFVNVLVIAEGIRMAGELNDGGWLWAADSRTVDIALSGYVLLFLGILILTRAAPSALASRRSTPSVGG